MCRQFLTKLTFHYLMLLVRIDLLLLLCGRCTPAAVLSSKIYEFEKQQSDIYVEKRLLTKRIEDMQAQVRLNFFLLALIVVCVSISLSLIHVLLIA